MAGRLGRASVPAEAAKNSRLVNPGRIPPIDPKTLPRQAWHIIHSPQRDGDLKISTGFANLYNLAFGGTGLETLPELSPKAKCRLWVGHFQTSGRVRARSAVPPTTDVRRLLRHVRKVPTAEARSYSITTSALATSASGTVSPSAFAVLRLTTSS